ncbi:hypothetical protein AB0I28_29540 [Phytomonospora sp. NPDC050363]|uniref:hypothetical protein n=1 Tax=Phytomonospora sp. NPDC050363 TaxID=3155642 RepID=UPI0033F54821
MRAPFLAPPKDRNNTRLAVTIVVGVVVLALCGIGALFGLGGLLSWFERDMNDKAQVAATAFLGEIEAGDFDGAYQSMCPEARDAVSPQVFQSEWVLLFPPGTKYGLDRLSYDEDGNQFVPVVLTGGAEQKRSVDLHMKSEPAESEDDQAGMSVCGWVAY